MSRGLVALAAALALLVAPGLGEAKNEKRTGKGKAPRARLNMPKGWSWPPTKAMDKEGQRCLAELDRLGVKWQPAKRKGRIVTPVIVPSMELGGVRFVGRGKGPHVMDCTLARALARSAGPGLARLGVVEVRFGQLFKMREVAGKKGVLSRHALGLAMDVYAFVTADGTTHVVLDDYASGDLLVDIETGLTGTGAFRTLLTPGNDPDRHDDHFHLEARAAGDRVVTTPPAVHPEADADPEADDDVIVDIPPPLEPARKSPKELGSESARR